MRSAPALLVIDQGWISVVWRHRKALRLLKPLATGKLVKQPRGSDRHAALGVALHPPPGWRPTMEARSIFVDHQQVPERVNAGPPARGFLSPCGTPIDHIDAEITSSGAESWPPDCPPPLFNQHQIRSGNCCRALRTAARFDRAVLPGWRCGGSAGFPPPDPARGSSAPSAGEETGASSG